MNVSDVCLSNPTVETSLAGPHALVRNHDCGDCTDHFVVIYNQDFRSIYANKKCYEILKEHPSKKDYLLGRDFFFFAPDFPDIGAWDAFNEHAKKGQVYNLEPYMITTPIVGESIFAKVKMFKTKENYYSIGTDITQLISEESYLQEQALLIQKLEDYNTKLKSTIEILQQMSEEKKFGVERDFFSNLEELVFPMLEVLKNTNLDDYQRSILDILSSNLNSSTYQFARLLRAKTDFTSREIEIANLIRFGKITKEIAELLNISCKTVDYHRANIRKKLKINRTDEDLKSYLSSLPMV